MEEPVRVRAKDIVDRIRETMLKRLEEIYKVTLAPATYIVHLRQEDHDYLEGIFSEIRKGAELALNDDLKALNDSRPTGMLTGLIERLGRSRTEEMNYKRAGAEWDITFRPEADGDLPNDSLEIESLLDLDFRNASYSGGNKTMRAVDRYPTTSAERSGESSRPGSSSRLVYARISYEDQEGNKGAYEMTQSEIRIGRGSTADLVLNAPEDISRVHVRIRYSDATRQFEIKDTSSYGSTVNGAAIPTSSAEDAGGWTPLPPKALISLANMFFLEFSATEQM